MEVTQPKRMAPFTGALVYPLLLGLAATLLVTPLVATAQSELCVPVGSWLAPTVDGQLLDQGWIQATRYVHANSTANPHGALQAQRIGNFLYVSFEAHNDADVDKNDMVVVAFGTPPDARMLEMRLQVGTNLPVNCANFATQAARRPAQVVWRTGGNHSSGAWTWANDLGDPGAAVLPAMFRCDDGGGGINTTKSWFVEAAIPASYLPANTVPFYAAIIRSGTLGAGTTTELTWPSGQPIVGLLTNLPAPLAWGTVKIGATSCPGMYVASWANKIRVNGGSSHILKGGQINTFEVDVSNSATTQFDRIKAAFFYQRFGIVAGNLQMIGNWTAIPPTDPTAPPHYGPEATVSAAPTPTTPAVTTLQGPQWNIPSQSEAAGHACVAAVLDQGANANTPAVFQSRGGVENMEFDGLSSFAGSPLVSSAGLKPATGESKVHLALQLAPDIRLMRADGRTPPAKGTPVVRLNVPVHGYQLTRRYLEVDGQRLEIVEPVASFAYVLDHALDPQTIIPAVDAKVARARTGPLPAGLDAFAGLEGGPQEALAGPRSAAAQPAGTVAPPKVSLADFAIKLDGFDRRDDKNGAIMYVDLEPGAVRALQFAAQFPKKTPDGCWPSEGCCCKRISSPTAALLFLGLAALWPIRRRRK
jgi:hypothetical protein